MLEENIPVKKSATVMSALPVTSLDASPVKLAMAPGFTMDVTRMPMAQATSVVIT